MEKIQVTQRKIHEQANANDKIIEEIADKLDDGLVVATKINVHLIEDNKILGELENDVGKNIVVAKKRNVQ